MNETPHTLSSSRTLWELVTRRAALTPDRPLFLQDDRSGQRTLTFGALHARAERVAAGLHGMGVRPGTVVAWQLPTRIETALLSFALARIGAVQTPVIPFYRERETGFALRESRAEFFAVPGEWRGFDHAEMARRLGAKGVFEAYGDLPDGDPSVLPPPPADGTAVRWIYWTSGTTSDPKGVLHTDRSLIAGGSCLAHALRPSGDDVGSIAFPYAHIGGPDYTVMLLLYGFPAVLFEQFALPDALESYHAARGDRGGRVHGVLLDVPGGAAEAAGDSCGADATAAGGRRGAEAAGALPRRRARDGRAAHPRVRHDRGAHDHHGGAGRHPRAAGDHRGAAAGGDGDPDRGRGGAVARGGRVPGVSGSGADGGGLRRGGVPAHRRPRARDGDRAPGPHRPSSRT